MAGISKLERARRRVAAQRYWIETHGRDAAGYIARYGNSDAPASERYGDGGQAIYAADVTELATALYELSLLEKG